MLALQLVEKSSEINFDFDFRKITMLKKTMSDADILVIRNLSCGITYHDFSDNMCVCHEPSKEEIEIIVFYLRRVYYITKYFVWYAESIKSYRLVFGF